MGKAEKGNTSGKPNRAKGLQKLKFFCQMCQKQCRDAHGFKCHLKSESHQRQLLLFSENTSSFMREFNTQFESAFIKILKSTFGTKRVRANDVYQEYIRDRSLIHMNATSWTTLTGFIHYLAKVGKAKVDENEKGWWIQYIDKAGELRKKEIIEKAKTDLNDEEIERQLFLKRADRTNCNEDIEDDEQIKAIKEFEKPDEGPLKFDIKLNLAPSTSKIEQAKPVVGNVFLKSSAKRSLDLDKEEIDHIQTQKSRYPKQGTNESWGGKMEKEDKKGVSEVGVKKRNIEQWIVKGIIVKINTRDLGSQFYKQKGEIIKINEKLEATIQLNDGETVLCPQNHLETVIPSIGKKMRVVSGPYRGKKGELRKLNEDEFNMELILLDGSDKVIKLDYEDACKY
uniref:C2H2-type domain-containing protein n=1 Tax=Rhabditophanes sp. KR3021 TaxID=114890 RepID=A0AC35U2J9_9BILA